MKISIIGSRGYPYVYSGYETFVAELAPRLVKNGHQVTVYCHRGLFKQRSAVVNGVELCYVPAIEQKVLSQFSHSLLSTLHVIFGSADLVLYVNSANGPFGLLTRLFRKRTAINVDGLEWLRPKWKGLGSRYFRFASSLATKLFDVVIADSDRMAEIYKKEFDSDSVTIAYGANLGTSREPELIREFGIRPREYYLIVGRLIPDNNADLIVRAFEKSPTAKALVVLGDVPYKDSYVQAVKNTKDSRIVFPGYVRDMQVLGELYSNCFAYIHGHEFGGTNPALLKALAYGCCVLALDTIFNREVLLDGKHGILFKKEEKNLVEMIKRLELDESLVEEKRESARSRITERYTWELVTRQYEDLFVKMAST